MNSHIKRTFFTALFLLIMSVAVAAQEVATVTIGVLVTDDAINPTQADAIRNGVDLAVDDINGDGGIEADNGDIYRLRVQYEMVANSAEVEAAVTNLQAIGAVAIVGPHSNAYMPATLSPNVPMLLTASGIDGIYSDLSDAIFQLRANDDSLGRIAAEFAVSELDAEEVGLVAIDALYADATAEAIIATIEDADDVDLIVNEMTTLNMTDMTVIADAITEENPDTVIIADTLANTQTLLDALSDTDWSGDVVYVYGDDNLLTLDEGSLDFYALRLWSDVIDDTASEDFIDLYENAYDTTPSEISAVYYDGINLLIAGLTDVGNDADQLQTWLTNTADYEGVQGTYTNSNDAGELIRMALVVQVDGGELTEEQRYTLNGVDNTVEEMSESDESTN